MNVIDEYLRRVEPDKRAQLERIRRIAKEIVPDAKEMISYNMPTLALGGKPFLGFEAHAKHIGIYPFSGKVLPQLMDELADYGFSKGALRVPLDRPITKRLLRLLIKTRLEELKSATRDSAASAKRHPRPMR